MSGRVDSFRMRGDTPTVIHRPKRTRPHVAAEVRELGEFSTHDAEEFVRFLKPWARENALGIEGQAAA